MKELAESFVMRQQQLNHARTIRANPSQNRELHMIGLCCRTHTSLQKRSTCHSLAVHTVSRSKLKAVGNMRALNVTVAVLCLLSRNEYTPRGLQKRQKQS